MSGYHQILSKDCRLPPSLSICKIYSIRNTLKRWIRGIISGPKSRAAEPLGRDSLVVTSAVLNPVMHGTSDHRNQPFKKQKRSNRRIDEPLCDFKFAESDYREIRNSPRRTKKSIFSNTLRTSPITASKPAPTQSFSLFKLLQQPKRLRSSGDRQFHRRTQHTSLCQRD